MLRAYCIVTLLLSLTLWTPASAQTVGEPAESTTKDTLSDLRARYTLPMPSEGIQTYVIAVSAPGSSVGTPTAFGADWRDVFAGVTYQQRIRYDDWHDGAIAVGFGLGDARRWVGLEVALTIYDLIGDTFEDGSVSVKVHRRISDDLAVAVGVENAVNFGVNDSGTSVYAMATNVFHIRESSAQPFSMITATAGVGNGRFRLQRDVVAENDRVNVFGSVGVRVLQPISAVADWSGQDLYLGLSIAPFKHIPIVITPAVADLTGSAGDGARFVIGVGYGVSFY